MQSGALQYGSSREFHKNRVCRRCGFAKQKHEFGKTVEKGQTREGRLHALHSVIPLVGYIV